MTPYNDVTLQYLDSTNTNQRKRIYRARVDSDFPSDINDLVANKNRWYPFILEHMSKNGWILYAKKTKSVPLLKTILKYTQSELTVLAVIKHPKTDTSILKSILEDSSFKTSECVINAIKQHRLYPQLYPVPTSQILSTIGFLADKNTAMISSENENPKDQKANDLAQEKANKQSTSCCILN